MAEGKLVDGRSTSRLEPVSEVKEQRKPNNFVVSAPFESCRPKAAHMVIQKLPRLGA